MESGINADQNFYSRRPIPSSTSPEQHNLHQTLTPHHPQPSRSPIYEPPPLPNFESRTPRPQLPPKLPFLTTANLQAVTANGYSTSVVDGGDPAEFYRDYRGVQQSANGYTDHTNGMALIASESRPQPSSLRSNGNGTTPKHPSIPGRNINPAYRSVSSPVDAKLGFNSAKPITTLNGLPRGGSSVKDLLKKFDSGTNDEQLSSTVRKPSARSVPKHIAAEARGYSRDQSGYISHTTNNPLKHAPSTASRVGSSTRDNGLGRKSPERSRATQRTRFATEDQHSNNTLSSATRTTRPRHSTSGPQPSKSMMNLSPISPPAHPPFQAQTPERRPLFGEVLPIGPGLDTIGFGIPHTATRRTSDSGLRPNWVGHQKSRSDVDVSPSSPTAWYRGATPALDNVDLNKNSRSSSAHNRNHSDFADAKVNTMNGVKPSFDKQTPPVRQPPPQRRPLQQKRSTSKTPSSRLPVSKKQLSESSEPSSPISRATSPLAAKALSNSKTRNPGSRPWSAASHPSPPMSRSMSPTQKATRTTGRGRKVDPVANGSLNAYISAAPPKASPPLRSSRPRQPVSSASTPDRLNGLSRSTSHQVQTSMKLTRNGGFEDPHPRSIPENGPIDFAAKRARIQRAYTKSIHESEQREIRAANMRRLSERHARDSVALSNKEEPEKMVRPEAPPSRPVQDARMEAELGSNALQINTSFSKPESVVPQNVAFMDDSPTLGMTSTFEEEPASAISCATGITDIDNEPQTEEAHLNRLSSVRINGHTRQLSSLSSQILFAADELSPEQAMFGYNQEHQGSIDIMLAPTRDNEVIRNSTMRATETSPPVASMIGENSDEPKLTSNFYTESPTQESPANVSRPSTSFETHDGAGESRLQFSNNRFDPHAKSYRDTPEANYRPDYAVSPDTEDERHLQVPNLHTALDTSSVTISEPDHDFLITPGTDIEDSDSIGPSASRRQSTYGPYDANQDSLVQVDRRSHQSHWTDYSVNSALDYNPAEYSRPASGVNAWDLEKKFVAPVVEHSERPPSPIPPVPPKPAGYSPLPSPNVSATFPRIPSPSHERLYSPLPSPRLPPVATGNNFLASMNDDHRLSATSGPLLQGPDYTPPLPPLPFDEQPRAPTRTPPVPSLYNHTRPSSSAYQVNHNEPPSRESQATSGDRYSAQVSISNPGTSPQTSFEDVQLAQPLNTKPADSVLPAVPETEEQKAVRKKRLVDRRHLIMELVDTESVYLKDMNVVAEIYQGTAEACPKLDANDIKILFRNTAEIVTLTTSLLDDLKAAAAPVYSPRQIKRSRESRSTTTTAQSGAGDQFSMAGIANEELLTDEQRHERTLIGAKFLKYLEEIYRVYFDFLKDSEIASARLLALQEDPSVKVWLSECNIVAKDLTNAWDLDALLVKPVQRITRYQLLFNDLVKSTEKDHPDYDSQAGVLKEIAAMLDRINDKKARVGNLAVSTPPRRRKESDVRLGLTKMLGRSKEKTERPARIQDDEAYFKLHQQYSVNFLQLQVVLRDVEQYTRQVKIYVDDFLKYLSAIELWMRLSASRWPELESKWARFNMSMRDMGTVVLEEHISSVQRAVVQPFEKVIAAYAPPEATMKKRAKRRLDYEKLIIIKNTGGKLSEKDAAKIDEYETLNKALKVELPLLSTLTEKICNICMGQFIMIQTEWWDIWQKKVKTVLEEGQVPKDVAEIVSMFNRDYQFVQEQAMALGIVNGKISDKIGEKAVSSSRSSETERKGRPSNLSNRSRGLSINSDWTPNLPTPEFPKRLSGQFVMPPLAPPANVPQLAYSTPYPTGHSRQDSGSPATTDGMSQPRPSASSLARPNTGRSFTSDSGIQGGGNDYNTTYRRESGSTHNSYHDGPPISNRPYSGIFHSAMPLPDGPEDSARSSRASSRDRNVSGGYKVLYLAASLFEFNISATKTEAGYPYLTYQAGEIFDVIAEKGELWLAKNQDDPSDLVGWIWSKHFARLAND